MSSVRLSEVSNAELTTINLDGVVSLLKQAIPIATIYNLSKSKSVLDLIIVLEKRCGKALDTFENVIDMSQLGYQQSFCTLHTFSYLSQQICEGNFFYSSVCIEENVIYRKVVSEKLPLPNPQVCKSKEIHLNQLFKIEMGKACSFFEGGNYFIGNNCFELAVFMLQQAVEFTYRCFLNLMRGKDIKCHTLCLLRRNVQRFAPNLIGVFSENEEEELSYLHILEKGYCDARYDRTYIVDRDMVILLRQKVWELHSRAFDLFANMMITIKNEALKGGIELN